MKNYKQKPRKKSRSVRKIYLPAFALYSNLAVDTMKSLTKPFEKAKTRKNKETGKPEDYKPGKRLEELINAPDEEIKHYIDQFTSVYPFVKYIVLPDDMDKIRKINDWVQLLIKIRNRYSHNSSDKHNILEFDENIVTELQYLYNRAVAEAPLYKKGEIKFPQSFNEIFQRKEDGSPFLNYTGIIFYISLFLRQQDVNDFLSELMKMAIEQGAPNEKSLEPQRKEYREKHPSEPYPEKLQVKNKDFLYGNSIYTYWSVRGHVVPIASKDVMQKIRFFELMNYLKQCPRECIDWQYKNTDVPNDKAKLLPQTLNSPSQVEINGNIYSVREKNNFIRYALNYWSEKVAVKLPQDFEWQWARMASAEQKQQNKREKGMDKLRFHETVVWQLPADDERISSEGIETTFPYYTDGNNVFFRLKMNEQYIVGMMSTKVLCDLLRTYLTLGKEQEHNFSRKAFMETWNFMYKYLTCTQQFKDRNTNLAVPVKFTLEEKKALIAKEQFNEVLNPDKLQILGCITEKTVDDATLEKRIRQKVTTEKQRYEQLQQSATAHKKMQETVKVWFDLLNYGETLNWTHAVNPDNSGQSMIAQYRTVTYYLSRLTSPTTELSQRFKEYLQRSGLEKLLNGKNPNMLNGCYSLNSYFEKAMKYRLQMLATYEQLLQQPFVRNEWKATEALRWLRVRTPERARVYGKRSPVPTANPRIAVSENIMNLEKGVYFATRAVSLPDCFYSKTMGYKNNRINAQIDLPDDFYTFENIKLIKAEHFRKIYAIKQQDLVLTHIAMYNAERLGLQAPGKMSLTDSNDNYQGAELDLPYEIETADGNKQTVNVRYFYRYLKQSRYRIAPILMKGLLQTALHYGLVSPNGTIPFNKMMYTKNESGENVFVMDENVGTTVYGLYVQYSRSRLAFIKKVLKIDRKLFNHYEPPINEKSYVKFSYYVEVSKQRNDGYEKTIEIINEARRAALHGQVCLQSIEQKEEKLDFFAVGFDKIKEIEDKIGPKNKRKSNSYK